jgi:hypothetical protein
LVRTGAGIDENFILNPFAKGFFWAVLFITGNMRTIASGSGAGGVGG